MAEEKKPFHERVAEKIIDQLKAGTAPWQRPWNPAEAGEGGSILPMNPTTGKRYRGVNIVNLMAEGHEDNRWMTYKQAAAAGAQVRKGEKGTLVQYWKFDDEQTLKDEQGRPVKDAEGKTMTVRVELERPRPFYAVVFNAEQIDGLPPRTPPKPPEWNPIERADALLRASGADIHERPGNRAFYTPALDAIVVPERSQFPSADRFYATALHEAGHWTGHPSRLDRDLSHPFGSEGYAKEELRAEIASMILGDELQIGHDPEQHVAYVGSWIKALEDDPMEIVRACADAEKINTYMLAFEQKQVQEQSAQMAEPASIDAPADQDEANRRAAMATPIAAVLHAPDHDFSHYHSYNHSYDPTIGAPFASLDEALAKAGMGRIGDIVGDQSRDYGAMLETAMERLSPVFGIAADDDTMSNAYLERKGLAGAFAEAGERLIQTPAPAIEAASITSGEIADVPTPINVPYREKNAAKELGAKWDKDGKTWYVPAGIDQAPFAKWAQEAAEPPVESPSAERAPNHPDTLEQAPAAPSAQQEGNDMTERKERRYLAVPYGERNVAKAAGAKWDAVAKSWYAPEGSDPAKLTRWNPENRTQHDSKEDMAVKAVKEFAEAMKAMGLTVPQGHPIMDGTRQRVPADGDKGKETTGSYRAYLDGHPAGHIENFRTNLDMKWKFSGSALSEEEKARLNALAATKLAAREQEQAATYEETARRVQQRAAGLTQIAAPTPYMVAKGIAPTIGALTDGKDGTIHLPAIDASGKHWTTQYIQEDGTKRFAKDSHKEGCFHVVNGTLADLEKAPRLMIGEGYATMTTISGVVDHATVAGFDAGNLPAVAKALHERFPDKPIFIVADDDQRVQERYGHNPGRDKANEAAQAVGGKPLHPIFAPGEQAADPKRFTDFNDIAQNSSLGLAGVERQVKAAVQSAQQALPTPKHRVDEEIPQQRRSGPAVGDEPAQRRSVRL